MKIIFVVPYPLDKAPSQRFRFEQYLGFIEKEQWIYKFAPFIDEATWQILYMPGNAILKVLGILRGFINRIRLIFSIPSYDFVFIHREATPIGPPWFEWIVSKVLRKKIIYDFDDAIWIPNVSKHNKLIASLKWHSKIGFICKWAYKISCGNSYLQDYARGFNLNAFVVPTTIDTINLHNEIKDHKTDKIVIGWTGTHSTMKYLEQVVPVLQKLEAIYDFEFCVISNEEPVLPLNSLIYKPWQKGTEISDLLAFDVGLMPLEDDSWAKGKCAFKALQYMALGIPALISPVGMNVEVVDHDVNGYICQDELDWFIYLEKLINDKERRIELGRSAREKIVESYSVESNMLNFMNLFI
jgi:glycosyltransferase involved in cell wall biosynthesis